MSNDTVITGIGVMAPTGQGTEEYWKATKHSGGGGPLCLVVTGKRLIL